MAQQPSLIGSVGSVSGSTISVRLTQLVESGIAIHQGKSYRIGQVGTFVRIPLGYHDLFGVVTEAGATAVPATLVDQEQQISQWLTVQLLGEAVGNDFERGISQYPTIGDDVHIVTETDLRKIYGWDSRGHVEVGRLANAEGVNVSVNLDAMVSRHTAMIGATGSGKSTTVASLLRSLALGGDGNAVRFPNSRVLVLDIHGEYVRALRKVARVFRTNPGPHEDQLSIPYWAIELQQLLGFLLGSLDDRQFAGIGDRVFDMKRNNPSFSSFKGMMTGSLTIDSPIPFSLKQLWFDLLEPEIRTWSDTARTQEALVSRGDPDTLEPSRFQSPGAGASPPFINNVGVLSIRRKLDQMRSLLLDSRFDFLLHPGPWEPDLTGRTQKDLGDLISGWIGHDRPISILDLSGIPSQVLVPLIGGILAIIYDSLFWAREKTEGGRARPLLIVMEEAHRYLSPNTPGLARDVVSRIVKEGRKFGIGAMIVSQRPSELEETVLSQCGTLVALRLTNSTDRNRVGAALPDNLKGLVESLPILRTGEAIVAGEAVPLLMKCRIRLPPEDERPSSVDPLASERWSKAKLDEDYSRAAASWRSQNPLWSERQEAIRAGEENPMDRESVDSSNLASFGYDPSAELLEIEFTDGAVYEYYNVPPSVPDGLREAPSKGQYFHAYIKNSYAYSRIG